MNCTRKIALFILITAIFIVSCGGGGASQEPANLIAEQSCYNQGGVIYCYLRGPGNNIYFSWSYDGQHFARTEKPVIVGAAFPVLVYEDGKTYLIVKDLKTSMYNVYDVTENKKPTLRKSILQGGYFNIAAAVVNDKWITFVEGKIGETFVLMESWANKSDLNLEDENDKIDYDFRRNLSGTIINDAGNPSIKVVWINNEPWIIILFGHGLDQYGTWRIGAAVIEPSGLMRVYYNVLVEPGVHLADPDFEFGEETNSVNFRVGYNQTEAKLYAFYGTPEEFLGAILSSTLKDRLIDKGVIMRWEELRVE